MAQAQYHNSRGTC